MTIQNPEVTKQLTMTAMTNLQIVLRRRDCAAEVCPPWWLWEGARGRPVQRWQTVGNFQTSTSLLPHCLLYHLIFFNQNLFGSTVQSSTLTFTCLNSKMIILCTPVIRTRRQWVWDVLELQATARVVATARLATAGLTRNCLQHNTRLQRRWPSTRNQEVPMRPAKAPIVVRHMVDDGQQKKQIGTVGSKLNWMLRFFSKYCISERNVCSVHLRAYTIRYIL